MISYIVALDQPIGGWDVSSVTTLYGMFRNTVAFNQPIGDWGVSCVMTMNSMFRDAKAFDQPVGDCNVSSVTTMNGMFCNTVAFGTHIFWWKYSFATHCVSDAFRAFLFSTRH